MTSFPQGVTVYMVLGLRVSVTVTHQFHYSAYLPSFNFVCFKFSLTGGDRAGEQLLGFPVVAKATTGKPNRTSNKRPKNSICTENDTEAFKEMSLNVQVFI